MHISDFFMSHVKTKGRDASHEKPCEFLNRLQIHVNILDGDIHLQIDQM